MSTDSGAYQIPGVQDDAGFVDPLQIAGFANHAMYLASAFQQGVY